jgi:hypothetical protein
LKKNTDNKEKPKFLPLNATPEHYRIFVVVAETVQHPLEERRVDFLMHDASHLQLARFQLVPNQETRTIVQPAGRQFAQGFHVARKLGYDMLRRVVLSHMQAPGIKRRLKEHLETHEFPVELTTIVKTCRDSYELHHVQRLCDLRGIHTYNFQDRNPEVYGEGRVTTAMCTEPIDPTFVMEVLDYLPLWKGEEIKVL